MEILAVIYLAEGRLQEAESLQLQGEAKQLEPQVMTIPTRCLLWATSQKRVFHLEHWGEADQLFLHVTEKHKTKLGKDHPDMLRSMQNLACIWKRSGKTADAINLATDCLAKQKQVIGSNHPHTMLCSEILR
ncbi:hypothetical protein N7522_013037, partial [Penicillium canescens]